MFRDLETKTRMVNFSGACLFMAKKRRKMLSIILLQENCLSIINTPFVSLLKEVCNFNLVPLILTELQI